MPASEFVRIATVMSVITPLRNPARRLSSSDERELVARVRDGDRGARDELVESMLPLVRQIARSYANKGETVEDLVQVGAIGLLKAIDRFDLDRQVRLSTFASPTISGEIKRHFRDRTWAIHTPRDLQELYAAIRRESGSFEAEFGVKPTIPQLCEITGREEEAVMDALSAGANFHASSLDAPLDGDGGVVGDAIGLPDHGFDLAEARAVVSDAAKTLDDRSRRLLVLHYSKGLSQREIAERMGLSQMHVSRLLHRALETLRTAVT